MADSISSPTSQSININPNLKSSKNIIHIGGIPVEFPYQPYGTQLAFMNRVISTLDRSHRDGNRHALLESPTGTGKSLALLCSTLAWQRNRKSKNFQANLTHSSSKPNPEATTDPINHGGGFIPETQPSGNPGIAPPARSNVRKEKSKMVPTIFYSSRTHAQITQVIQEYKKTSYRVPMSVLGSRKHYCTNPHLRGEDNVDEQCKLLLKNKEVACSEFKNVHKVKGHPSLQKGGCHEVHDIEDLVKIGQIVKGCSYFAARSMAQDAELVFCPYNYIINPVIRNAMEVDIDGSIIILDEAHNMEDTARDAGSVDIEEEVLIYLQTELEQLSLTDAVIYQPLLEMTQDILSWIDRRKQTLQKHEFQHYFNCWTGDKALKELEEANLSLQCFPILRECATKAVKAASEAEPDVAHLSGMAATTLEGLFSSLSYFFSGNGVHAYDYELALQRSAKREGGGWTHTFSLWCLNPAVVFKSIADVSHSVILTSGTLSPLNTFSSELGVQFGTSLEAPHVIDVDSQVWTAVISNGPGNYPLNASYKTADEYAFQDALGKSVEEICKVVPGGCLVFFPSYKLLDKVSNRWQETGQWSELNAWKPLFVEPRGSSQDGFPRVLKNYYSSIRQSTGKVIGRKIRSKKSDFKNGETVKSPKTTKNGAAFLAVCRGKVSEGIDFSDENARAVVIVGIPFPNINNIKVAQKKKFNDRYESSKNLVNGNEWYCHQAFRALNQAIGRCIRHRFDYGAVVFLDERFRKDRNRTYISKWLRKSIRLYDSFEESLEGLKSFFDDVKDRFGTAANSSENIDVNDGDIKSMDWKNGATLKKNQKVKSSRHQQKLETNILFASEKVARPSYPSIPVTKYHSLCTDTKSDVVMLTDEKDASVCREYIDLDYDSDRDSRLSAAMSPDDTELTFVKETPVMNFWNPITPETLPRNGYSCPTEKSAFTELPQQSSDAAAPTKTTCMAMATPERGLNANANSIISEVESSWSVNSHVQKRRKFMGLSSINHLQAFDTPITQAYDIVSPLASSVTITDANHRTEEKNNSENECSKSKSSLSPKVNNFDGSHVPSGLNMDQRLQIFCLRCRNPLGLPENDLHVMCSLISSSKVHVISLWMETSETLALSTSTVHVVVSDILSVDQRLLARTDNGAPGQGIWCKEDGCVFNSIFCPMCIDPNNCLGVQVVATDASNVEFQNKMLFYLDRLEIKNSEMTKDKAISSFGGSCTSASPSPIEKFAYIPPPQDSGGWRSTKSRLRLPRKGLVSSAEG
ncbi:RAD3-like DNA-binding helicase protein [Forsythia ovata]|uniref:DNA 5'-3' helicase FANCJ n=1 Tax=Forsythia ovata TaxID=205694 RepID=A0ABD1VL45_9LAMI